ncbi:RNA-binding protein [Candidatus Roizmanbacteria bacterium RIFCSPHIGHO2_01_FULL_39_12c]|uniref:RNA-binding protein n=1 Tax=Candidatus Roizmanbacteria bacterium RIFCSPHIGHO2_01_FULL_39_12c TaxID=1802031 RepID=A0A1F7GAQ4_9BACT|nr:MAG: RNA-binding protein [Candidatus Roizmanbacteria bacterium RIFCSPHIGHO2_01_FULL_39_12c]OGK47372.1 MAG: RNA-binding protein [Candidatus Roizmanbacteria bacterium RIFCSPLOWO2_01_FULL_40_13]
MDKNKLFVGSLPWSINNDSLKALFEQYGEITEAVVIMDRNSGRSKGFGFVTFAKAEDAQKALEMNGKDVEGRSIVVNTAKPREERSGGGGGFRSGGGGDYRRNRSF